MPEENKKNKKEKQVIRLNTNLSDNSSIELQVKNAQEKYYKPAYNNETRQKIYDNGAAHRQAKEREFANNETILDPYTGAVLFKTKNEAKLFSGEAYQENLAEADHIDPLNKIYARHKNDPFLEANDLKRIGNRDDNYQVIARTINQTSKLGKGGDDQESWSRKTSMTPNHIKSGESTESVKKRMVDVGKTAEKNTDKLVRKSSVKNMLKTGNEAGKATACQSMGNAATISSIYNVVAFVNGDKAAPEAIKDVGVDVSKAGISGYIKGNSLTVINHTLSCSDSKFIAALGKKNVTGKTITVISIVGDTVVDWGNGKITTQECLTILGNKTADVGGSAVGSSVGNVLGSSLGTIVLPGAGTVIGGTVGRAVGGIVGGELCCGLYRNIIDEINNYIEEERRKQQEAYEKMMKYYAEEKRRKEVNLLIRSETQEAVEKSIVSIINSGEFQRLCFEAACYFSNHKEAQQRIAELVLVSLQIQDYQRKLKEYRDNCFQDYKDCLDEVMCSMEQYFAIKDYDNAIIMANNITKMFGKEPIIDSVDDFNKKIFGNEKITF